MFSSLHELIALGMMPHMDPIEIFLADPGQTTALAREIAPHLGVGDVVLLHGDIGAGKSHFARAVILALLAEPEDVPSPTFTLVQTYNAAAYEIWHADLYRLNSLEDVYELGLIDAFDEALCLIEWPDRLETATPVDALHLHFRPNEDASARFVRIDSQNPKWNGLLQSVSKTAVIDAN